MNLDDYSPRLVPANANRHSWPGRAWSWDSWHRFHDPFVARQRSELPFELFIALPKDALGDVPRLVDPTERSHVKVMWYASREEAMEALREALKCLEVEL